MHTQLLDGEWQVSKAGADEWIPAVVPGCIHTDLMKAGAIPDPFGGDNEKRIAWVAETDWIYRRAFEANEAVLSQDRVFLECFGLDTLATIRLNGEEIGRTEDMYRTYRFDVTGKVLNGQNTVEITFASPVKYIQAHAGEDEHVVSPGDSIPNSPYLRKAPYQFGWDWGPKIPTSGIWRSIQLAGYTSARLDDVRVTQVHGRTRVEVHVEAKIERFSNAGLMLHARLTAPDGTVWEEEDNLCEDGTSGTIDFLIENPSLWWPNGYGDQPLYTLDTWLEPASPSTFPEGTIGNPKSAIRNPKSLRLGLRELHLCRNKDEFGESFYFSVNDVPVFCKGANWIPADQFPSRLSTEDYRDLIESCAAVNMNMLRVWGGGIYEDDRFYDLCDEYGILIWQDFMFACAHYPVNPEFLENVRQEAIDNIRRIRSHPCLAIWCGNNEMEWGVVNWWPEQREERQRRYAVIFYDLIPSVLKAEDDMTPYWPSSPASGTPFVNPNSEPEGDGHYWEVWHGRQPFTAYQSHYFRFMSEFGFQSLPSMETVKSFAEPEDWNMTSYIMECHQKNSGGNGNILYYMAQTFRFPKDFPMMSYTSQLLQAEAMRYGVEHWRRARNDFRCMGTLYWQANDCWPAVSWSSLEYNHHWKATHYSARRFYAPILLSAEETPSSVNLHLTNDTRKPFIGEMRWSMEKLDGTELDGGAVEFEAPGEMNTLVADLDLSDLLDDDSRRDTIFVYELWQGDDRLSMGIVSFIPTKHLELPEPGIRTEVVSEDGVTRITLMADQLARFVMLDVPGSGIRFSDNYFDLPAGRSVVITVDDPAGLSMDEISAGLTIISLRDSY